MVICDDPLISRNVSVILCVNFNHFSIISAQVPALAYKEMAAKPTNIRCPAFHGQRGIYLVRKLYARRKDIRIFI